MPGGGTRLLRAALFPVMALSCGGPSSEGLAPEVGGLLGSCDGLPSGRWDWCAVQALKLAGALPGAAVLEVCDRLEDPDANDHCIELAVRSGGVGVEPCDRMTRPLLRSSCLLEATDQALAAGQVADIDAALALCERTGSLRLNCHVHIVQGWQNRWAQRGVDAMTADVTGLLAASPDSGSFQDFGFAVGRVAREVGAGPGQTGPCTQFADPVGSDACWKGLRGERLHQGGPDAYEAPPSQR